MTMTATRLHRGDTGDVETAKGPATAVIVHRDRLFARGLELLLDDLSAGAVRVVAHLSDAGKAQEAVRRQRPDVVVMGLSATGAVLAVRALKRAYPAVTIIALVPGDDPDPAIDAFRAGADGVVDSSAPPDTLLASLEAAAAGVRVAPPAVLDRLLESPARHQLQCLRRLDPGERQLWRLVADGFDSAELARALLVSPRTAKRRVAALLRKLGVDNRVQAAALAGQCGLLDERA